MGASDDTLHLELFGGVWWRWRGTRWPAPAGRPSTILVLLAAAEGAPVSADALIDHLWPENPPASGRNALRRHISRVRAQLRQRLDEPIDPIVREAGGYRLATEISTDLGLMEAIHAGADAAPAPTDDAAPRWWEEPLAGLPWEPFTILRSRLAHLARAECVEQAVVCLENDEYLAAAQMLESMASAFPADRELWILTVEAARRSGDHRLLDRVIGQLQHIAADFEDDELAALAESMLADRVDRSRAGRPDVISSFDRAATEWLMGRPDRAVEIVRSSDLDDDTNTRLQRILASHQPDDGLVRSLLSEMVGTWRTHRPSAERTLVSLDARRAAVSTSTTDPIWHPVTAPTHARIRSLRSEYFARLGLPLQQRSFDIVGELTDIGSRGEPDAAVEATRFAMILAARQGRFGDVIQLLDDYDEVVVEQWPLHPCGFGDLSRLVLSLRPGLDDLGLDFSPSSRFLELATDRATAELAQIHQHLVTDQLDRISSLGVLIRNATTTLTRHGTIALRLFWFVATDRLEEATTQAASVIDEPLVLDAYRHYLPAAVASVAIATEDRTLARFASRELERFADEEVGLWPLDLLLGPANDLLDRLEWT